MIHRLSFADTSDGTLASVSNTDDNTGWVDLIEGTVEWPESGPDLSARLAPLQDATKEQELANSLSGLILDEFVSALEQSDEERPVVVIRPSPALAQIPWGLIEIQPGVRLMERARVVHGLPLGLEPNQQRTAVPAGPPISVIDPYTTHAPVLSRKQRRLWSKSLDPRWGDFRPGETVTRVDLSLRLNQASGPAFLFFGHCLVADEAAGGLSSQSGILLTDREEDSGSGPGESLVLTAQDLAIGSLSRHQPGLADNTPGPDLWPMPQVVAVIGCGSGSDHRFAEPFGLAAALRYNGAQQIVGTLWDLETDEASLGATSDMGIAVAEALLAESPVDAMDQWSLERLQLWRETGDRCYSPATWGALAVFDSPDVISQG